MHIDACDKGLDKRDMYSVVCYVKNNPLLWYRDGLLSFDSHTIWVAFIPKSNKTHLILVASCMSSSILLCQYFTSFHYLLKENAVLDL